MFFSLLRQIQSLRKRPTPYVELRELNWSDIGKWMKGPGNPENIGRGYVGGKLISNDGCFIRISKERKDNLWYVTASLIANKRDGVAATQTWVAKSLERGLEAKFGNDYSFSIRL